MYAKLKAPGTWVVYSANGIPVATFDFATQAFIFIITMEN